MTKRIDTGKLIASYIADQDRLDSIVETAEAEIRAKLAPYLSVGTFTEQDIKPLADKLVAAEKAEFERKWAVLADFVEDDESVAEEPLIPSYDTVADLEQLADADSDNEASDTPYEQEPKTVDTIII